MTNEDRKMLECAATAAGYETCRMSDNEDALLLRGVQEPWNSITDDGDAFRLARDLDMILEFEAGYADVEWIEPVHDKDMKRAITLAAARLEGYEG